MTNASDLQDLADRQAITDLIYRYCRSMDRIDAELGYTVFHDDASVDYEGHFKGSGRGFIDQVCEQHRGLLIHSHQVSNIIIELDGDHAASKSYVTATLRAKMGEQLKQIMIWCRYVDQWSRRNTRWAIDKRVTIIDFDEIRDVTPMSQTEWSRRDRSDPSYAVFKR